MELGKVNSKPLFMQSKNEYTPSFDYIEKEFNHIIEDILANNDISDSEHALIRQIMSSESNDEILQLIDQLIDSCTDSHPYISYYHFWKGMGTLTILDEEFYEKELTQEEVNEKLNLIVKEMDASIRLNDTLGAAYYVRGIAKGALGYPEAGCEDFEMAMKFGCEDARDFLENLANQRRA